MMKSWMKKKRTSGLKYRNRRRQYQSKKGKVAGATAITWTKKKLVSSVQPSGSPGAMTFALTDAPDNQIFGGLFDQYKITGIKVQFYPEQNVNTQGPAGSGNFVVPTITYCPDYTDASNTFSETDLLLRENVKTALLNKPITVYLKPKPNLVEAHGTQFMEPSKKSLWLATHRADDSIDNTSHYGLKYIVGNGGGSSQPSYFRTITTYYVAFKQGRTKAT